MPNQPTRAPCAQPCSGLAPPLPVWHIVLACGVHPLAVLELHCLAAVQLVPLEQVAPLLQPPCATMHGKAAWMA